MDHEITKDTFVLLVDVVSWFRGDAFVARRTKL